MSAWKPGRGTYEIDRIIPPIGRVRLRTGTHDARIAARYEAMLDALPLDVIRLLLQPGHPVTLREVYDLWIQGRPLPSADELRPLVPTLERWLEQPLTPVGDGEQLARAAFVARIGALAPAKAGLRALPGLCRQLYLDHQARGIGAAWNRRHAAAMAFLRDTVGIRAEVYVQVADLPRLPEPPKLARHPCTVHEARAIREQLGAKWGAIWWALCCHGLGPKEYWRDGWTLTRAGVEIRGQKRPARNRVVPLVCAIPAPAGTMAGFAQALERADLGVTPYDARRTFSRWLDELHVPRYQHDALLGHGPRSMRELYSWGEITAWLPELGRALRAKVGERKLALEAGGAL